mmetsp:Transcript_104509/g.312076  ORF Transcript_104509/g.312076 Transcript_104509/m.312076 type:complete len:180 (-) Transcript_104509:75-614(-)
MKSALAGLALAVSGAVVGANTMVMKKCQGHMCEDAEFPLMDWDAGSKTCHCRAHPCHHDQNAEGGRVIHSCSTERPFLGFSFTAEKALQCECREHVFAGSVYIARELCPGHTCEDGKGLLLDYDEAEGKCVCIQHPCNDDNGIQHSCPEKATPILAYHYEDTGKLTCKCHPDYKAKEEL